jgi:hypothetical protein
VLFAIVASLYGYLLFVPARQELQAVQAKQFELQR